MTSYDCETRLRIADGERRKALGSALRAAAWDGGAQTMGRMLEGLGIPGEPHEPDADAHYVALAAEVLLGGPEKAAAWEAAGRTFLCGCHSLGIRWGACHVSGTPVFLEQAKNGPCPGLG